MLVILVLHTHTRGSYTPYSCHAGTPRVGSCVVMKLKKRQPQNLANSWGFGFILSYTQVCNIVQ